jgi:hypothetical protein
MRKLALKTLGALALFGAVASAQDIPRVETFFGYSWARFDATSNRAPAYNAHGGDAQLIYNFNRWVGIVGDFGGYHNGSVGRIADATVVNFQVGPRLSFRKRKRVNPYVQALFGGVHQSVSGPVGIPVFGDESTFAMLLGGGVDIRLGHRVAFRPFEADYFYTRLHNPAVFTLSQNQDNVRLSGGFAFRFGGEKPTPPPAPAPAPKPKPTLAMSLTAPRTEVCEGESISLTPTMSGTPSGVNYKWTVNGQAAGTGQHFDFATAGHAPGAYRIGVTAQGDAYQPAQAETAITVKEYRAPTGTVQASPAEVMAGGKSTLTATFEGQCGGTIGAPVFTASEGAVNGTEFDSTGVTFDAAAKGEQRKPVTITASATDERNHTGTATTTVTVIQPATIAAVRLPDILFPSGSARVNNCGKRVLLEQLRSYFERDPGGKAVLVGHRAESEPATIAQERVRNAAAVITAGTGICTSVPLDQVVVSAPGVDQGGVAFEPNFCAASVLERPGQGVSASDQMAQYRRVTVWFVPTGGKLPESLGDHETAAALNLGALGCPK